MAGQIPNETPKEPDHFAKLFQEWRDAVEKSATTRTNFHQQLAILCAGSLAVIASGAGALMTYRASHVGAVPEFPVHPLLFAATALWLSLVCCIAHNFLETLVQHRMSETAGESTITSVLEHATTHEELEPVLRSKAHAIAERLNRKAESTARRTIKIRTGQLYFGWAGVFLFVIGYAGLVYLLRAELQQH